MPYKLLSPGFVFVERVIPGISVLLWNLRVVLDFFEEKLRRVAGLR